MIIFSGFRKEQDGHCVKVVCDIKVPGWNENLPDTKLWISTDQSYGYMLNEKICDGYFLIAMVFGMYFGQDVKLCGRVSKRIYYNLINYGQTILINHDPGLKKVDIEVDGFLTDDSFEKERTVVGAPCSFGIDALSTLYDRWMHEEDADNKINAVFSFNCGINGSYEDPNTKKLWSDRTKLWKAGFDELGLPIVNVDTNIHQFLHNKIFVYATACYLSRYFCILNLQGGVKKYYLPSEFSYGDILNFGKIPFKTMMRGTRDISLGYEEPMFLPLLSTEHMELVLDGAQYQRTEKTEKISKWDFTYKYLNVCQPGRQLTGDFSRNCSRCPKCVYTMFCLETMGKLNLYSRVFDIDYYYANKYTFMCQMVENQNDDILVNDALRYAEKKRIDMPSEYEVRKYYFYKWKFSELDSYIGVMAKLFDRYKGSRIVLWGTGHIGSIAMAAIECLKQKVDAVVDADRSKHGQRFFGDTIQNYSDVRTDNDVVFVCGIGIYQEIKNTLGNCVECVDVTAKGL